MSENEREIEPDAAWLLAREGGPPGPAVSDATAVRYARLQSMITDLPATPSGAGARAGWQQEVLAAIDAAEAGATTSSNAGGGRVRSVEGATPARVRHRPRRWGIPAAIFVSTAVVVIGLAVYHRGGGVEAPTIAYEVEPSSAPQRGADPSVGDTLIVRAVVEGPGELRIYN
ncbi:MAG TPA: hypothetical protein VHN14_24125, partial [Kofleriaceae bacterium]|nr:hypothetical protein [Kofleriaceae bacterium]